MPFAFRSQRRSGLTLVEILIALTMTLIVLGTMMTAFKWASEEMQNGRALIELANRARIVEDHLRTDLGSLTVEPRVYNGTDEPNGYFEYVEGPVRDASLTFIDNADPLLGANRDCYLGDCDDVLAFTARSTDGVLYRGRQKPAAGTAAIIESSLAEIVWFTLVNDNEFGPLASQEVLLNNGTRPTSTVDFDDSVRLYRRVLLIRPDLGTLATFGSMAEVNNFIRNNDISVRVEQNGTAFDIVANSLNDLAIRENRFAHQPSFPGFQFPNLLKYDLLNNRVASDQWVPANYQADTMNQAWDALPPILTDLAAFDLQVYSPTARVMIDSDIAVEPGNPGYVDDPANPQLGAYVDLGYSGAVAAPAGREDEWFFARATRSTNARAWEFTPAVSADVWDTWTPAYESDGIDQDRINGVDQSTNGINDDGSEVIDDPGERETTPPYLEPLRAMKITVRLVEKGTKQVHQVSVINSFVPE